MQNNNLNKCKSRSRPGLPGAEQSGTGIQVVEKQKPVKELSFEASTWDCEAIPTLA